MALRNTASSFGKAVLFQISRNQQQISGAAALSTIGDGSWHGNKGKQEKASNTFHSHLLKKQIFNQPFSSLNASSLTKMEH